MSENGKFSFLHTLCMRILVFVRVLYFAAYLICDIIPIHVDLICGDCGGAVEGEWEF